MKEGERGWGTEKRTANTEGRITDTDNKADKDMGKAEEQAEHR